MLKRLLHQGIGVASSNLRCGTGLPLQSELSIADQLHRSFGVTSVFACKETCSILQVARNRRAASIALEATISPAHSAVNGSDQSPYASPSAASVAYTQCIHQTSRHRWSHSDLKQWDGGRRVSLRDFATVPSRLAGQGSRAARKIAKRRPKPSDVIRADPDAVEEPSQSDSREVTEANEGKPSDVQVKHYCHTL